MTCLVSSVFTLKLSFVLFFFPRYCFSFMSPWPACFVSPARLTGIVHFCYSVFFSSSAARTDIRTYTVLPLFLSLPSVLLDPRLSAVVSHSLPSSLISLLIPSPHTPPFPFPYCSQSSPFWLPFFPSAAPSLSPLAGVGAGAPLCGSPLVAWSRELCASGCDGRTAVKMTSGPPA